MIWWGIYVCFVSMMMNFFYIVGCLLIGKIMLFYDIGVVVVFWGIDNVNRCYIFK